MNNKRMKGPVWLLILMAMLWGVMADMAGANSGLKKSQALPVQNDLLQFKAGSHVMGFKPDKAYFANTAGFLSVEFLDAHAITPQTVNADAANGHLDDVALTQDHGDTLANLQRVEYQGLWNGITLRYDAAPSGIAESTYVIQPGADVADIRLRYNADTELQRDGSLKIQLATRQGYISESSPVAWQVLDGRKKAVEVAYEIQNGTIGFKTGPYDKDHELIIDPIYQWHTFHGSANYDEGYAIAVDGDGNVYVTGMSYDTWGEAPLQPHNATLTPDIVVLKLDSSGVLQWNTFYGSSAYDRGYGIIVDGSGNVYVTGYSIGTWGSPVHSYSGGADIVTFKLDSSGVLQWNTFYGSGSNDEGHGITLDKNGNIYVTGQSPATWGTPVNGYSGGSDIVTFKLDSTGALQWNTFNGSASTDYSYGIGVDGSGNVFVTGQSNATWGSPLHGYSGGIDIVVFKLDSSGALAWNTFYGVQYYDDYGYGIAVDGGGNAHVTGKSYRTWGSPVNPYIGGADIVVFKLNSSGALAWNTFYGSTNTDIGQGIAIDGEGNVYVTGQSNATWGSPSHPHAAGFDIMALKLSSSGIYQGHAFYGSGAEDEGAAIAVDGSGNVYVTGYDKATWGIPVNPFSGYTDIVVLKISAIFKKFPWPMFMPAIAKGTEHG